ncbi:hypothetical protein BsWGS_20691 [Bradybaena similaris]
MMSNDAVYAFSCRLQAVPGPSIAKRRMSSKRVLCPLKDTSCGHKCQCPPVSLHVCQTPNHSVTQRACQPLYCSVTTTKHYQPRYDDGYSSQNGVVRLPLLLGQPAHDGEFLFRHPPCPLDKPLRTLPASPVPWWPVIKVKKEGPVEEICRPHYRGLTVDYTRCPPNITVLKHF